MFSNNFSSKLPVLICLFGLGGCVTEDDSSAVTQPLQIPLTLALETQIPEQTHYQQQWQFHGVIQGIRSYNETIFEQAKIVTLHAKEGQFVQKGAMIAQLYSPSLAEKLAQAQAGLKRTQAQLKLDKHSMQRSEKLFAKNLLPQQSLDEARRDFEASDQAMKEAQAKVALADNEFADTIISAKESALVSKIFKREGDYVNPGDPVIRFESVAKQKANFSLPEKLAIGINHGDKFALYVPSTAQSLTATVIEKSLPIEDGIRLHTVTFEVDSLVPDLVGLRVVLRYNTEPVLAYKVDYRAVHYNADKAAYLVKAGNPLSSIPVDILTMNNDNVVVAGNMTPDTPILIANEVSLPLNLHRF